MKIKIIFLAIILIGCSHIKEDVLVCMHIDDRNGFSEMISSEERLYKYKDTDFLSSQPYKKVVRILKNRQGKKKL